LASGAVAGLVDAAKVEDVSAGKVVIAEGADDKDIFVVRRGSMIVEKAIGGQPVFLSYLPAGSYFGEMAVIDGSKRTATVKAAIKSEVVRFTGAAVTALLERKPALREKALAEMDNRRKVNAYLESQAGTASGAVEYYSKAAQFL